MFNDSCDEGLGLIVGVVGHGQSHSYGCGWW